MNRFVLLACTISSIAALSLARADEVWIYPEGDNTLYQDPTGSLSNGSGAAMFAGRTTQASNNLRRALVAFTVIEFVPFGATITSAELRLYVSQSQGPASTLSLHRMTERWASAGSNADAGFNGGENGAPAQTWDATWLHRYFAATAWSTPGGVFVAGSSGSQTVNGVGYYVWGSTPEMVADVQLWAQDHSQNAGWIIIGDEGTSGSVKRISTREEPNFAFVPVLIVNYTYTPDCSFAGLSPCDTDCNGTVNPFDIQPFVNMLMGVGQACSSCAGDANGNGTVNPFDINAFIDCLIP